MDHPFDADTAVEAAGDQLYTATITDRWNGIGARPNGGYALVVCLQALRGSMPFPDPFAVSAFFLRPTAAGPALVTTEIARVGRRVATGEGTALPERRGDGARRGHVMQSTLRSIERPEATRQ